MAAGATMNRLRQAAQEYLAVRRALGFKLRGHDRLLTDFLDHLDGCGATSITVGVAVAWATAPADVSPVRWSQRLSVVRGFARHLHCLDPLTEVPPDDVLACRRRRPTPYLYSEHDIALLVRAATDLRPLLRAATYEAFFGLLAVTGMRVGEAIALDDGDVNLHAGVVEIKEAKFRKHRRLPLHHSTVAALRQYTHARDELCPSPKDTSFFVSMRGTRLLHVGVHGVFRTLVAAVGLEPQPDAGPPRVHGLRHSFAVATVRDWHRHDTDPTGKLSLLSAYLGHSDPAYTYWYLQACPELLGLAAERLDVWERARR
jgi:integrase/recombinase XerD